MKKSALSAFALAVAAVAGSVNADVLFTNPITGTNPNTVNPFTAGQTVAPNLTVSGIGRGAGATGTNANDRYNANSWNTTEIDLTAFFEWTLTPTAGNEIDFVNLVYTGQASGTGANQFAFRSSVDGFTANVGTPVATANNIDLSGATFQNIQAPVTFRVYGWGASSATGTFSINDFTYNGFAYAIGSEPPVPNNSNLTLAAAGATTYSAMKDAPVTLLTLSKTGTDATNYTVVSSFGDLSAVPSAGSFASGDQSTSVSISANRGGRITTNITANNLLQTNDTDNQAVALTAYIFDASVAAPGANPIANKAGDLVLNANGDVANLSVALARQGFGFLNVTGDTTNSFLVYLDIDETVATADTLAASLTAAGFTGSISTTDPRIAANNAILGVDYDLLLSYSALTPSSNVEFGYEYPLLDTTVQTLIPVLNIGAAAAAVPEPTAAALLAPAALALISRRRR